MRGTVEIDAAFNPVLFPGLIGKFGLTLVTIELRLIKLLHDESINVLF